MSRKGIPVHKYAMNRTIQAKAIIAGVLLLLPAVFGHADSPLTVRHLASEQNIITLNVQKRFLLLPIQDNAPEGRVTIVIGNRQAGTTFNVRLAREHTDYFVPLDLSGFTGKDISLAIHGMPAGAICWKEMKCSDSFDTSNTGKYRPVYHQSPTGTKWMDWGKDHYATVTFSNAPEGRCIALGWMSNWQYQGVLPTEQYRGANTIARDLSLYRKDGDIFLKCAPSREIEKARKECDENLQTRLKDICHVTGRNSHRDNGWSLYLKTT